MCCGRSWCRQTARMHLCASAVRALSHLCAPIAAGLDLALELATGPAKQLAPFGIEAALAAAVDSRASQHGAPLL